MKTVNVLLAGYGNVGKGFHELVHDEGARLAERYGVDLRVTGILRSRGAWVDPDGIAPGGTLLHDRKHLTLAEALEQANAHVLVELVPTNMQTGEPGRTMIRQALEAGIPVVTADKGPLVVAYKELTDLAREKGVPFRFEGSVGGAIPALNMHEFCLKGNEVLRVDGILNGTSNFILSRMAEEGLEFEQALQEAQELGYAEADPTYDVDGFDAAAKLVILANHVLGLDLAFKDVDVHGIRSVTGGAMRLAQSQGYALRLIGSVDKATGRASVAPRLVPVTSSLNVGGALNVVKFRTQHAGELTAVGKGAGGTETATAVLSDVLNVVGAK